MQKKVIIFGDEYGVPFLLRTISREILVGVVLAANRPGIHAFVEKVVGPEIPVIIQPRYSDDCYTIFYKTIERLSPNCLFCNSYSMLIRNDILRLVDYHAFNIHASYLPYNRGPNPIQWAIIRGDNSTGVTIHRMDSDFDTGEIVNQVKLPIAFEDTWVSLRDKLSEKIIEICKSSIPAILAGDFYLTPQDDRVANKNERLTPECPQIKFSSMSDLEIYNLIRAQVRPLKGAYVVKNQNRYYFDEFQPFNKIPLLRKAYE